MPLYSFAAIIITQNDERLEDVTIQSETDSTIVILQQGAEITLPISTIKGILYDNGTYKEISHTIINLESTYTTEDYYIKRQEELKKRQEELKKRQEENKKIAKYKQISIAQYKKFYKATYDIEISKNTSPNDAKKIAKEIALLEQEKIFQNCIQNDSINYSLIESNIFNNETIYSKAENFVINHKFKYYLNGTQMTHKEYVNLLKTQCPTAYKDYSLGNILFYSGAGSAVASIIFFITGSALYNSYDSRNNGNMAAGIGLYCLGSVTLAASIPLMTIGSMKNLKSHKTYNKQCKTQNTYTLNLQVQKESIGLALNF